jgi:hypothetical protein
MDELRESSLLFSLESLLETERERVQREAREAQRKREEEIARVAEVAERRRLAQQQEREARERREQLEQEREQQDHERREAMKRAVVERARLEAEGAARLAEAEQARKHELSLAELRARHQTARYRLLSWLAASALGLSWASVAFGYVGLLEPAYARREQRLQNAISAATERAKSVERQLSLEHETNRTLQARLDRLGAAPPVASATATPPKPSVRVPGSKPPVVEPPPRECVDNGDPLDAQLCRGRSGKRR